jgi:hypothetical protein
MINKEDIVTNDIFFVNTNDFNDVFKIILKNTGFEEINPKWDYLTITSPIERWFKYKITQENYLLIEPDPPYAGLWRKIDPNSPENIICRLGRARQDPALKTKVK